MAAYTGETHLSFLVARRGFMTVTVQPRRPLGISQAAGAEAGQENSLSKGKRILCV